MSFEDDGNTIINSNSDSNNSTATNAARRKVALLLLQEDAHLWLLRNGDDPTTSYSQEAAVRMATTAMTLIGLLKEYPSLAAERFAFPRLEKPMYPLAFYILNSFGTEILDQVYALYPNALQLVNDSPLPHVVNHSPLGCPSLRDYTLKFFRFRESDETLLWLLSHNQEIPQGVVEPGILIQDLFRRMEPYGCHLSFEVIKSFYQKIRDLSHGPVKELFKYGYSKEIVGYVLDNLGELKKTKQLMLSGSWEFDQNHVDVILPRLQLLKTLVVNLDSWSIHGWCNLLGGVQTCANLRRLDLCVDTIWLWNHPANLISLAQYLANKPSLTKFTLDLVGTNRPMPIIDGPNNDNAFLENWQFLQAFAALFPPNQSNDIMAPLYQLKLHSFQRNDVRLVDLKLLASSVDLLTVHFPEQNSGTLGNLKDDNNDDFDDDDDDDPLVSHPVQLLDQWQPGRGKLDRPAHIGTSQVWDSVTSFSTLEECLMVTGYSWERPMTSTTTAPMRLLTSLSVDVSGVVQGCNDITNHLVCFLKSPCLKRLYVRCGEPAPDSDIEDPEDVPPYEQHNFQLSRVCQALEDNKALTRLELEDLDVRHTKRQEAPLQILRVLQHKNATLQYLTINDHKVAYTLLEPWLPAITYIDYYSGMKIQFFLWLNECGRQKLRDKTTTKVTDLIPCLVKAMKPSDKSIEAIQCALVTLSGRPGWSGDYAGVLPICEPGLDPLTALYCRLRESVLTWSTGPLHRYQIDIQGTLYALLRESPDLWCNSAVLAPVPACCHGWKRKRQNSFSPIDVSQHDEEEWMSSTVDYLMGLN